MDQNKILKSHITLGSDSGNLYEIYLNYIRAKYGNAFVDDGLPFVTPYEDTFQGWGERILLNKLGDNKNILKTDYQETKIEAIDIEYEEIKPKLLGDGK